MSAASSERYATAEEHKEIAAFFRQLIDTGWLYKFDDRPDFSRYILGAIGDRDYGIFREERTADQHDSLTLIERHQWQDSINAPRPEQDDLIVTWRKGDDIGTYVLWRLSSLHAMIAALDQAIAELEAAPKPSRTQRPRVARNDLTVMSDPHTQAAIRGIYAAGNGHAETWRQQGDDAPMYLDKSGVLVYTRANDGMQLARSGDIEAAWRQILSLDDRHVSTFLICLGKWFAETGGDDAPTMESARVSVDDVLGFRGAKKHVNGGYKTEQKREARDAMLALNNVWVRSTDQVCERRGRGGKLKTVYVDSRLLEVAYESDKDLLGEEHPYAFRVRPGEWAAPYLGVANRRTALLLRPIMQNDLRTATGRFAMRIGIYLTMQWRIRASRGNYAQPWELRTLLEGACVDIEKDGRNFPRFRQYVEDAMDKLQTDGVLRWHYVDVDDSHLPKHRWFPEWLKWRVWVEPNGAITERYQLMPGRRARGVNAAKAASRRRVGPAAE